MFEISGLARQYAPWSTSKLELAASCPQQFELKHIKKAPEEAVRSENKVGVVGHAILEWRVKGKSDAEARKLALVKTPLTSTEKESLIAFTEAIERFLTRFDRFCRDQGVTQVLTERKWAVTADGRSTRFFTIRECHGVAKGTQETFWGSAPTDEALDAQAILASNPRTLDDPFFRGVVDLAVVTASGDVYIIDHKSGAVKKIEYKRKQLDSYAALAFVNLPGIGGVRCGINSLTNPAHSQLQWLEFVEAEKIRRVFLPWLFKYVNESAKNLETFAPRPKKKWPCDWCPYRISCEAFKRLEE